MATMVREAWSDERLDDLSARVDDGFSEMRREFRTAREEAKALRAEIRDDNGIFRGEMKDEFKTFRNQVRSESQAFRDEMHSDRREISAQLATQNRMMIQFFGWMFTTMALGLLGVIVAIVVHG